MFQQTILTGYFVWYPLTHTSHITPLKEQCPEIASFHCMVVEFSNLIDGIPKMYYQMRESAYELINIQTGTQDFMFTHKII